MLAAFPGRFITEIVSEIRRLPVGMLEEVLEAKGYQQAKEMVDRADTPEAANRLPTTPLFKLVQEIERDLVQEWKDT